MIVVTLEFPDERVGWVDHLHVSFPDRDALEAWLPTIESLGKIQSRVQTLEHGWVCPSCRWKSRPGQRRAAKVALGRGGSFTDLE